MKFLILDSTLKSIAVKMSGAPATTQPSFVSSSADWNGTTFMPVAKDGALNGVTYVTVVDVPGASTQRTVKEITICNIDTAPVTIYVDYDDNGTYRRIASVTLNVGDTWTTDGTFDSNGNLKTSGSGGGGAVTLTGDATGTGTGTIPTLVGTTTIIANAGASISALKAVYISEADGRVYYADSATPANAPYTVGVTITSNTVGNPVNVRTFGLMTDAGFSFSPGPVFVGSNGALTQTNPSSGMSQIIGFAAGATSLLVKVGAATIL